MHLKTIKLLGFKSFVDSQILELPSRITAIVGPNGCGKSNVIDAIKWVIGESHAKQLRGDHMTDVIFNGSTQRKPVGQAHVELTFDNSSGILKGPFSHYNEVTVKRVIDRDASSVYAINQTRCRRKDVIDLFTGTGLGPRSYAIIEQGMINRFIEAKPSDLRGYLEEAAGISRYYEKRKETLSHLEETTENLNRIKDLEDEIQRRCVVLEQQAIEATQYQKLRQECVTMKQQYLSVMYREALKEQEEITIKIQEQTRLWSELEKDYFEFQKNMYELEKTRDQVRGAYNDSKDDLHQKIQLRQQSQNQIDQITLKIQWTEAKQKESLEMQARLQAQMGSLAEWLALTEPLSDEASAKAQDLDLDLQNSLQALVSSEKKLQIEENAFKKTQSQHYEENRKNDALALQIRNHQQHRAHKKDSLKNLERDRDLLTKKYEASDTMPHEVALASWDTEKEDLQKTQAQLKDQKARLMAHIQNDRTLKAILEHDLNVATMRKSELEKQIIAYKETTSSWLNLAQQAESVTLKTWENQNLSTEYIRSVPTQFFYQGKGVVTETQLNNQADLDLEYVWGEQTPSYWKNYILMDSTTEALSQLESLADHQAFLLPGGIVLGKNWVRPWRQRAPIFTQLLQEKAICEEKLVTLTDQFKTVMERLQQEETQKLHLDEKALKISHQIENLQQKIQKHLLEIERLKQTQKDLVERKNFQETQIQQAQKTILRLEADLKDFEDQRFVISQGITDIKTELLTIECTLKSCKQEYQEQLQHKEQVIARKHEYVRACDLQKVQYEQNYQQYLQAQKQFQDHKLLLGRYESELAGYQENRSRELDQIAVQDPDIIALQAELQRLQTTLQNSISALQKDQNILKQLEKSYAQCAESLQAWKVQHEKIVFHQAHLNEQILDQGWLVEQIIQVLSDSPANELKKNITIIEERIRDLGAVNLKALQEYEQQSQRHQEYGIQRSDLEAAMNELIEAVALLDRDMKNLFDTTFSLLKGHFETLFPILFAGGFGSLTLDSDLNTEENGIIIHAQPPGKKNTRLSILSGGEKALTAAALVFSFFQLNPAPFCLLDEIDAPLDDTNTQRLGSMIASLKDRIQFIVVTHSKVMMEYAESLYGVTMKEPGVSKFVSINMVEALEAIGQ